MKEKHIQNPHGNLLDVEGRIIHRFANWKIGHHYVPDAVESVEYVDGPNDHDDPVHEDYKDDHS